MQHRVDLILAQHALEQALLAQVPANGLDLVDQLRAVELALRHPVADQTDDVRARVDQALDEPSAHQSRRSGDERRPVAPELGGRF